MTGGFYKFSLLTDEDFRTIQNLLDTKLSDKIKSDLQKAHQHFAIDQNIDLSRLSKTKAKLDKLAKALADFEDIDGLTEQSLITAMPHTTCPSISDLNRNIHKLRKRAEIALQNLPAKTKPGPNEKIWPLRTLVTALKAIYEEVTGKKATLTKAKESKKPSKPKQNTPRGDFYNFVHGFLNIVKYPLWSDDALMAVIEEVLYKKLN
jgi:hypothetical protein